MASVCKGCLAPILWRRHETTGKMAPIDAAPAEDGNVIVVDEETYRIAGPLDAFTGPRHKNHWATCMKPPGKARR